MAAKLPWKPEVPLMLGRACLGTTIAVHTLGSGKVHVDFDIAGSNANMKDQSHKPIVCLQQRQPKTFQTKSRTVFFPAWRLLAHPI